MIALKQRDTYIGANVNNDIGLLHSDPMLQVAMLLKDLLVQEVSF